MKIAEASITIKADGFNRLVEFPAMPMVDLIAELFRLHGAEIEVVLPDAKKAEFERLALKEWHTTATYLPKNSYVKLWDDKETEKYFVVQRIHKAFNEYVLQQMDERVDPVDFLSWYEDSIDNRTISRTLPYSDAYALYKNRDIKSSPAPEFFPGVKEQLDDALNIRKEANND